MSKRNIYMPNEIIQELKEIAEAENYDALKDIFIKVNSGTSEYLSLNLDDAKKLIRLVDIELSKAILKYPFNEDDDPKYNPVHEEKYDDVMMGIYEKTYYYLQAEFKDLNNR